MTDTGWVMAGSGANVSGGGYAWSSPGNVTAEDGAAATVALAKSQTSDYLKATNFGLSPLVPAGATIDGVAVQIKRYGGSYFTDVLVQLLKAGSGAGSNYSAGAAWASSWEYKTFGGPTSLWGTTLTRDDVVNSGFGFWHECEHVYASQTAHVDAMWVKVYFTSPASTNKGQFFALM